MARDTACDFAVQLLAYNSILELAGEKIYIYGISNNVDLYTDEIRPLLYGGFDLLTK